MHHADYIGLERAVVELDVNITELVADHVDQMKQLLVVECAVPMAHALCGVDPFVGTDVEPGIAAVCVVFVHLHFGAEVLVSVLLTQLSQCMTERSEVRG